MTSAKERSQFDDYLEAVLEGLPPEVSELLDEVPVIVEDEPSRELLAEMGIEAKPGEADLCGLHWGTPMSEQSVFEGGAVPGRIYLFRGPILRLSEWDPDELMEQIRITLLHEIGHLFGLDEDELTELGYE